MPRTFRSAIEFTGNKRPCMTESTDVYILFMRSLQAKGISGQVAEAAQDTVYRWLKQHIMTLPRHEGTFLTEAEVCQAAGTSRTPVREALLRLEADGFLK